MKISIEDAYKLLDVNAGSHIQEVTNKYKIKALEYYPLESDGALRKKRFKQLCTAYKRILLKENNPSDRSSIELMTDFGMFEFFHKVFRREDNYEGNFNDGNEDCSEEDSSDESTNFLNESNNFKDGGYDLKTQQQGILTENTAKRNADALLEDKDGKKKRMKAKRKAKKKKRKEKKKLEKENSNVPSEIPPKPVSNDSDSSEEDLDPTSAFVATAASKKNVKTAPDTKKKSLDVALSRDEENESLNDVNPVIYQARQMAIRGNELAKVGAYLAAADLFTKAMKLDSSDYRFYSNRAYCLDNVEQYDRALKDAEKVISMAPEWAKGYYRKGSALNGLGRFQEAEAAFEHVLKLDKKCFEAVHELREVRMRQIMDMGFSDTQASAAIEKHGNISGALESLLGTPMEQLKMHDRRLNASSNPPALTDEKMNPKNPNNLTSLWVGNLLPEVNDKQLAILFSKYGPVQSVKMLPEKYCAFVNYKEAGNAGKAMASLQSYELMGQKLKIRFPDNPVTYTGVQQNLILRKGVPSQSVPLLKTSTSANSSQREAAAAAEPRRTGPVNGNECFYWRTTGCMYGDNCRNLHIPKYKGVDKKPWHKSAYS